VRGGARNLGERGRSSLVVVWLRRRGRALPERPGSVEVVAIDTNQSLDTARMLIELTIEVKASV
jgi:hypothetical protein